MGKGFTKYILRWLLIMVDNMFFLDSEGRGTEECSAPLPLPPPKNSTISIEFVETSSTEGGITPNSLLKNIPAFLNMDAQIRFLKNRYTDLKSALV